MNRVILLGRLTKDPEVRYTPSGKVVAQFTLAVNRPYSGPDGQKEADFIPVVIWGKSAETLGNTVSKGQRLAVEGRMQTRNYDASDGSKRYVTEVIADRFEYVESRHVPTDSANPDPKNTHTSASCKNPYTSANGANGFNQSPLDIFGSQAPFDEEIPF